MTWALVNLVQRSHSPNTASLISRWKLKRDTLAVGGRSALSHRVKASCPSTWQTDTAVELLAIWGVIRKQQRRWKNMRPLEQNNNAPSNHNAPFHLNLHAIGIKAHLSFPASLSILAPSTRSKSKDSTA